MKLKLSRQRLRNEGPALSLNFEIVFIGHVTHNRAARDLDTSCVAFREQHFPDLREPIIGEELPELFSW